MVVGRLVVRAAGGLAMTIVGEVLVVVESLALVVVSQKGLSFLERLDNLHFGPEYPASASVNGSESDLLVARLPAAQGQR